MNRSYSDKSEKMTGLILASISSVLTISIAFWYLGDPTQFIEYRLGVNHEAFDNKIIWLLVVLVTIGYIIYTMWAVPFVKEQLFTFSWLKIIGIWAAFVSSIIEEIFFRQMLMDCLMNLDLSIIIQILASGLIFGIAHGAWIFLRGELKVALPVILSTTILGVLLAILYIVSGRNILAPMIAHIIINLFIEPWLILAVVSGMWDVEKSNDTFNTN